MQKLKTKRMKKMEWYGCRSSHAFSTCACQFWQLWSQSAERVHCTFQYFPLLLLKTFWKHFLPYSFFVTLVQKKVELAIESWRLTRKSWDYNGRSVVLYQSMDLESKEVGFKNIVSFLYFRFVVQKHLKIRLSHYFEF